MDALFFTAGAPVAKKATPGVTPSNVTHATSLLPALTTSARFPLLPVPSARSKLGDRSKRVAAAAACRQSLGCKTAISHVLCASNTRYLLVLYRPAEGRRARRWRLRAPSRVYRARGLSSGSGGPGQRRAQGQAVRRGAVVRQLAVLRVVLPAALGAAVCAVASARDNAMQCSVFDDSRTRHAAEGA